jgi:hypothetical protein
MIAAAGLFTWLTAAEYTGNHPATFESLPNATGHPPVPQAVRDDAFRRAGVYLDASDAALMEREHVLDDRFLSCRFLAEPPSGTTPKFSCVLENGETVKVKYGRNPEIQAEVAATRLLRSLGLAADRMTIVGTVRCYGCPRFPFLTMRLLSFANATRSVQAEGYTEFEWAAVEQKFAAPAIETEAVEGWPFWELKASQAPEDDIDALRLIAMFLAHWDNKASNQRLVCLDRGVQEDPADLSPTPQGACVRPLLMIQDLGATFGPEKVNLARWRDLPVWADRKTCAVSMAALPFGGATFPAVRISERARARVAAQLSAIDEPAIRDLFTRARFAELYAGTDDRRDIDMWTAAFKSRVDQIVNAGPCIDRQN